MIELRPSETGRFGWIFLSGVRHRPDIVPLAIRRITDVHGSLTAILTTGCPFICLGFALALFSSISNKPTSTKVEQGVKKSYESDEFSNREALERI